MLYSSLGFLELATETFEAKESSTYLSSCSHTRQIKAEKKNMKKITIVKFISSLYYYKYVKL